MIKKIQNILEGQFTSELANCIGLDEETMAFKKVIGYKNNGEVKPLLILGRVHSAQRDGHCLAILNPDVKLVSKLNKGTGYIPHLLKPKIAMKCDYMVKFWFNSGNKLHAEMMGEYTNQNISAARFEVE